MGERLRKWTLRSIGPIVLLYIVWNIDLAELFGILRRCSPKFLLAAYFMIIPALLLRAARWRSLLFGQGLRSGFVETVNVYSYSILMGMVTPGHIGEFIKVFYLKQRGLSLGGSFFSVFLDRILDILFLFIVGAVALFALISSETRNVTIAALLLAGVLGAFSLMWFFTRGKGFELTLVCLKSVSPTKFRAKMLSGFSDFADGFQRMTIVGATQAFALTAFAWTANYYAVYLLGRSLGFEISFAEMAGIAAIASFVALLPISVMGVGTRDAALIVLLAQYGVSEEGAVAFSALCLSIMIWSAVVCSYSFFTSAAQLDWASNGEQPAFSSNARKSPNKP
jgi:uncharacterized protein (TIRG00374 family)